MARPLCQSDAEAEDVVQDIFLRAFERIHRYAPRRDSRFAAWLCKRRRSQGRLDTLPPRDLAALGEAGDEAEHAARRDALLAALAELPERDRRVVTLRYGAELTAAEVGAACGLSEANVRKICERQRRSLLAKLGGSAPGEAA